MTVAGQCQFSTFDLVNIGLKPLFSYSPAASRGGPLCEVLSFFIAYMVRRGVWESILIGYPSGILGQLV